MKKKICVLLLVFSVLLAVGISAFAQKKPSGSQTDSGIHILWVNTDSATASLNFSGNCADCTSEIFGKTGTTKITATALLKRVDGNGTTTVKAWTGLSASGDSFYFDRNYYVSSGATYEFEIDAKVYRNGKAESVSESDLAYCG